MGEVVQSYKGGSDGKRKVRDQGEQQNSKL